jgi:hypothetical protein
VRKREGARRERERELAVGGRREELSQIYREREGKRRDGRSVSKAVINGIHGA